MNYGLIFRTVKHLRPTQIWHQVKYRLVKPKYATYSVNGEGLVICRTGFKSEQIPRYTSLLPYSIPTNTFHQAGAPPCFTFLNLEHEFAGWDFTENGMLWAYNQNYFDWLNQEGMTVEEGCKWIDLFNSQLINNSQLSLDPYPIALRSINWIKFFCRFPETATKERLDSLYSQVRLLEKKLEYHLLANHLLEDAYALFIAAVYFGDVRLLNKVMRLLLKQLKEQILPDGAHYEQSPMYHCILLDRLLDVINLAQGARCKVQGEGANVQGSKFKMREVLTSSISPLTSSAQRMLGHLESIIWSDGSIPLMNDAAYGIAPTPAQLFDYARRLGIEWEAIPMKECGYRKMKNGRMEAIVDVGNFAATYQPGHTHADSLNYELRIDGKPFVVDTGISTYNKNERRQLERSTIAHNCVVVDGKDSSEVWGGFRVGRRCHTDITDNTDEIPHHVRDEGRGSTSSPTVRNEVAARHDGFERPCYRTFRMEDNAFAIEDTYDGEAISYIHLAEGADEKRIKFEGAISVEEKPWEYSTEYNRFHQGKVLEVKFKGHLKTRISRIY